VLITQCLPPLLIEADETIFLFPYREIQEVKKSIFLTEDAIAPDLQYSHPFLAGSAR